MLGSIFMLFAAFKITVDARAAVAGGGERRAGGVRGAGDARASAGHGRDGGGNEMTEGTAMQQRDKGSDAGRDRGSDSGALVHADALTPKNVAGEGRRDDGGDEGGEGGEGRRWVIGHGMASDRWFIAGPSQPARMSTVTVVGEVYGRRES